jgi:hypothetical protein
MANCSRFLLTVALIALLSGPALAQKEPVATAPIPPPPAPTTTPPAPAPAHTPPAPAAAAPAPATPLFVSPNPSPLAKPQAAKAQTADVARQRDQTAAARTPHGKRTTAKSKPAEARTHHVSARRSAPSVRRPASRPHYYARAMPPYPPPWFGGPPFAEYYPSPWRPGPW